MQISPISIRIEAEPSVRLRWLRPAKALGARCRADPGASKKHCATWQPSSQPMAGGAERFVGWGWATFLFGTLRWPADAGKPWRIPRGWRWRACRPGVEALWAGLRLICRWLTASAPPKALRQCQAQALCPLRLIWSWRVFELHGASARSLEPRWRTGLDKDMLPASGQCGPIGLVAASAGGGVVAGYLPAMGVFLTSGPGVALA